MFKIQKFENSAIAANAIYLDWVPVTHLVLQQWQYLRIGGKIQINKYIQIYGPSF